MSSRWVIKIGSALLTADGQGLDHQAIGDWVSQMAKLHQQGIEVVLVSSGSVAEGMARLGWRVRPAEVSKLQAAAAVGQMGLVQLYESCFQNYDLHTAQVLLVHDDLASRKRYLNARSTMKTLLEVGVIPVVNENDTVATDEIRFGDNDTLAALVAGLVDADGLLILTDQQGLFDKDPRKNPDARLISLAAAEDAMLVDAAGSSSGALGRGGMQTKIRAARMAAKYGVMTRIASGREKDVITRIFAGETIGTKLTVDQQPMAARKSWLVNQLQTCGKLVIDDGAVKVLQQQGSSLLAVGVSAVEGEFDRGELVSCVNQNGVEVARGLVNYTADETRRVAGKASGEIQSILGYCRDEELVHRDNLVLV